MSDVDWFGEPVIPPKPPKWTVEQEDTSGSLYRACPFCHRPLSWRYDNDCDFTIGVPHCNIHGDLKVWIVTDGELVHAIGQLMDVAIVPDNPMPIPPVEFDSHRFKAVAPKRNRRPVGDLIKLMEGE